MAALTNRSLEIKKWCIFKSHDSHFVKCVRLEIIEVQNVSIDITVPSLCKVLSLT